MRNYFLALAAVLWTAVASASVSRGGFGLLFPDSNSLVNTGHTASQPGFSAEFLVGKFTGTHEVACSPSVAWSSGHWAAAAYGTRYGRSLGDTSESVDAYGVGLGAVLPGGTWTFGVAADRTADPHKTIARTTAYSTVGATVGFHPGNVWNFALSGGTTIGRPDRQAARAAAAVGWRLGPAWKAETVLEVPDLADAQAYSLGGFASWQGSRFYTAFGGNYLASLSAPQVLMRFGVIFGPVDLSAFVTYVIKTGENPFHGGALRVSF